MPTRTHTYMQAEAPTEGVVIGALWTDTDTGRVYVCSATAPMVWAEVGPPIGGICLWPDASPLPAGWRLCDGSNGSPNLSTFALVVTKVPLVRYSYIQRF